MNVEVEEFHPRNYIPTVQSKSTDERDSSSTDTITKPVSVAPEKVTILHRVPTEKCFTPTPSKTNKDKPEQINVRVSSAIDKSSTLISSISSRDKNDDKVNGVDNNKKIEKQVDPVNIKADLEHKVVMHPKQQENILENVKKTKFKNTKFSKSSPRKMNNGHKKDDAKIGKIGTITNGNGDSVPAATKEYLEPLKSKPNGVENGVGDKVEKSNSQPTYAQMVGPVTKPKLNIAKPEAVKPVPEHIEPLSTEELKKLEVIDEIKPVIKVETIWQTVRPKGKKKHVTVMSEEPNDLWNDFDEEQPVEVKEIKAVSHPVSQVIQTNEPNDVAAVDSTLPTPAKVKPPKTEKVKLKLKAKKSQKKIKEKIVETNGVAENENPEPNGSSTPKNDKMKSQSVTPIIDDLFVGEGHEFLNDIDISNFSFETNPSMFVNAITNSGIYTDNSMAGKSSAGFALNNSLKLLNTFDFCKTKENVLLKEEEEMVIRVLQSLNQTDDQIVTSDVSRCIEIIDDVKLNDRCDDVKIEKNISDVVNGHNEPHEDDEDDDKKKNNEVNGAEDSIKCELNNENNGMENGFVSTNGHQIEDTNIPDSEHLKADENQPEADPIIEPLTNGNHLMAVPHLNNDNGEKAIAQSVPNEVGILIDDTNDLYVSNVADQIETETNAEMIDTTSVQEDDCTSHHIKYDDETHSDLSELSDENDETIVSHSNDCFEYDEIETIKEIDVVELIDDLQFDADEIVDFVVGNEDDMNLRADGNEIAPQENIMIPDVSPENEHLPRPSTNIFIENEADILNTEITLNDIEENKNQDRNQSPRSSEDSGILENHDDGRYFSESDNDKPEPVPMKNFPLTEAVSRWLEEKQKEKSPEPIIRLPDDPQLSQRIEKSLMNGLHISEFFDDYEDDSMSDESETEFEVTNVSKNLLSNPLRVLFPRKDTATSNHSSNGIRKRVANRKLESEKASVTVEELDILEFWENDPMLQSQNSNSNSTVLNKQQSCSIESDLAAYESVYGKTIDYANLSANIHNNDDVFLSNNIRNNDNLSKLLPNNPINNNTDSSLPHASSINGKNAIDSNNKNLNCFKPPEICCMLM